MTADLCRFASLQALQKTNNMHPKVIKADGEEEPFDPSKLELSLRRSGAAPEVCRYIVNHIRGELEDGMTTSEIYQHAFNLLKREEKSGIAARYSIKRAVFDLGPSGFPFERFVSEILRSEGWKTKTGVAMNGKCAPHEVDVLAEKGKERVGIEVKFHNSQGIRTDVKDALYVHARFEDLKAAREQSPKVTDGCLVTNTRFTINAVRYGMCSGLTMVSWDYPRNGGLHERIEKARVHPITALTTVSDSEKRRLLDKNIVLCRKIMENPSILAEFGINKERTEEIVAETRELCK